MFTSVVLATVLFAQVGNGGLQAELKDIEPDQLALLQKYYRATAAEYSMEQGLNSSAKLSFRSMPILTYFNPVAGSQTYGEIFVWTKNGRPEVTGAIWSKLFVNGRRVTHSFHSLSEDAVSATRRNFVFWSPEVAGIEPHRIANAPDPAASPVQRLSQVRSLSREFTSSTIRVTTERELRLLPQPIYRFEEPTLERDGCLFIWLEDWDPELLMMIESRATPQGPKWHVCFARFTNLPVTAKHKGVKIWNFQENLNESALGGRTNRYFSVHGVDMLPVTLENDSP